MLVLETQAGWQLVEQVDHARLSGTLACAWGAGEFAPASEPLRTASARHDEGWAVWDPHPSLTEDGRPMSFLDAPVLALLSAYSACVDAIAVEDAHAGLLVSLHVTGLRRGRYGLAPDSASRRRAASEDGRLGAPSRVPMPGASTARDASIAPDTSDTPGATTKPGPATTAATAAEDPVAAFLAAEHARQERLRASVGLPRSRERHEYAQLQLFDVLSLELGLNDLSRGGWERVLDRAPTAADEPEATLTLRGRGGGTVAVSPWPFAADSLSLSLPRRLLRPGTFRSVSELREQWGSAEPEVLRIELAP